jgi:hypothetical protein
MPGYGNSRMPRAYIWCGKVPVTLLRINSILHILFDFGSPGLSKPGEQFG